MPPHSNLLPKGKGTLDTNFLPIIDYFSTFEKALLNLK